MVCCSVFGCSNNHRNKELTFFRFPKDEKLLKQWIWACRRKDSLNLKTARICSVHFQESDHFRSLQHELLGYTPKCCRKLKVDAIPSLHLPLKKEINNPDRIDARGKRIAKRDRQKLVKEILSSNSSEDAINKVTSSSILENLTSREIVDYQNEYLTDRETEQDDNVDIINEVQNSEHDNDSPNTDKNAILMPEPSPNDKPTLSASDQSQNSEVIFITYDDSTSGDNSSKDKLIELLLSENKELKSEIASLKKYMKQINTDRKTCIKEILKPIFTDGQIRCLLQDFRKRIQWSAKDIAAAIALRSVSANAYRYLRNTLHYPLPAVSTLRRCAAKSINGCAPDEIMQTTEENVNQTKN